ncbi:MAG: nascent polypeptide-associated complex protein [Candidatus Thermoplasmatota archaeon]|nr:nascent polypeptide-associated complex protein [Candidatus Thermoplasmatota archaeon]MCK4457585.1 nascent polypeptide-associated complex protein [Thermoplasmata archaeon]
MIPGGRMSPKQMQAAMKRLGIKTEELENVEEVVIRTADKEYIIPRAAVTKMEVQGQTTYQIVGEAEEFAKSEEGPRVPEEDVRLVAEKANVSEERARQALIDCDGELAEAIVKLMGEG